MSTPETQQTRTVASQVTVSADPDTAFAVFTDEIARETCPAAKAIRL